MQFNDIKRIWKKVWYFIWEDNSIWSWIVNVVLAFVLIKFIVYPALGFILSTSHPIVAVVSISMEHDGNFDSWWGQRGEWYMQNDITQEEFLDFPLRNGFNKGDIMILKGKNFDDIDVGDVIVFISSRDRPKPDPIIHRVVKRWEDEDRYHFQTRGDHNANTLSYPSSCDSSGCVDEADIWEEQLVGNAVFRVPLLGYIKIWFVELIGLFIR